MLSNERNGITVEIQQRANAFSENYLPQTDRQTDRQDLKNLDAYLSYLHCYCL